MKRIPILLPLLLVVACRTGSGAGTAVKPAPEPLACREVEGLAPLLAPGAVLLLGEIHGAVQTPAFTADAVCLALKAGRAVILALEIPRGDQGTVDSFLGSEGGAMDRDALLANPFWTDIYQDGRRSEAMLALLEEARRLRRQGWPLRVRLIDRQETSGTSQERDQKMAEALATAARQAKAEGGVLISLTGNIHSRITRGTPWDPSFEPAGSLLAREAPDLSITALDVAHAGGTAWTCTTPEPDSCQTRQLKGSGDAQGGRIVMHPEVKNGHHGFFQVGPLTASPPAFKHGPTKN